MGKKEEIMAMFMEKRFGFKADEVMTGTHHFVGGAGPAGEFPMEFRVTWGTKHVADWANPFGGEFMINDLEGVVTVGGLCENAPCSGRLELKYFQEGKIRYVFDFESGGKKYHFVGEKRDIRPWNLHRTHTTCYGTLTEADTGKVVSESITYFKFSTMIPFMMSFRPA
jgi:hypothetical protein